jgi:hypothetical protein
MLSPTPRNSARQKTRAVGDTLHGGEVYLTRDDERADLETAESQRPDNRYLRAPGYVAAFLSRRSALAI